MAKIDTVKTENIRATDLGKVDAGDSNLSRLNKLSEGDTVVATVLRQDPSVSGEARYERFEVPYSESMRVLDVLVNRRVKWVHVAA